MSPLEFFLPATYLLPITKSDEIHWLISHRDGKLHPVSANTLMDERKALRDAMKQQKPLLLAGDAPLMDYDNFAEHYDLTAYDADPLYFENNVMISIMALPYLREILRQIELLLPEWIDSVKMHGTLNLDKQSEKLIEALKGCAVHMRLPKTPLLFSVKHIEGEIPRYTFNVTQRYGAHYATLFRASPNCSFKDEILEGFLLYEQFCGLIPVLLKRIAKAECGPLLIGTLFTCATSFRLVDAHYKELLTRNA